MHLGRGGYHGGADSQKGPSRPRTQASGCHQERGPQSADIIDSLDLDYDTKIQAMEMGIKEFNRLYNEKLEEEYASLKDMTVDGIQHLGYDYSEDFDFDGVENE